MDQTASPLPSARSGNDESRSQINLGEVVSKYLEGLQRVYDVMVFSLAGHRLLNEQEYENFSRSHRIMPSQNTRMDFEAAQDATASWLLKQSLNESLGLLVLFLDDCRTIAAICAWKANPQKSDAELQKLLNDDRAEFLRLDLEQKIDALKAKFGLESNAEDHIKSLYRARLALANKDSLVSDKEAVNAGSLIVKIKSVQLQAAPAEGKQAGGVLVTSQIGDTERSFAVGQELKLNKNDHVASILTVAFFVTSMAQSLKDYAQKLGVAQ
jgi:hypothetical protein